MRCVEELSKIQYRSMEQHEFTYQSTKLIYYQSSETPTLLITSGFHGDETDVIAPLADFVFQNQHRLLPFLFIPIVCPSAVALGTRLNKNNADINRSYYPDSPEEEAQAVMHFLAGFQFNTAYSFHEHPGETRFYLYDMGNRIDTKKIENLKQRILTLGVPLFSGVDDLEDPTLGSEIVDGYCLEDEGKTIQHGFFNGYLLTAGISHSHLNPEIPGAVSQAKKRAIIETLFDILLLPPH